LITFLTGVPGAGKTYYAVNRIYLESKKRVVYTNVLLSADLDNVYSFNYKLFYSYVEKLFILYKRFENTPKLDRALNLYLRFLGIKKGTFFVIDECHLYLSKRDDVLIWLLSYHRHLYLDFLFVTQSLTLIYKDYLAFGELFLKAFSPTLSLSPLHFFYRVYPTYKMNEPIKTLKLKKDKKIFSLYSSGDVVRTEKRVVKILFISFLFLFFGVVLFFLFLNSLGKKNDKKKTLEVKKSVLQVRSKVSKVVEKKYYVKYDKRPLLKNGVVVYCSSNYCFSNSGGIYYLPYLIVNYNVLPLSLPDRLFFVEGLDEKKDFRTSFYRH